MGLSVLCLFLTPSLNLSAAADPGRISGKILDPQGVAVARAHLKLSVVQASRLTIAPEPYVAAARDLVSLFQR